jgi:hypothetical protein
MFAGFQITMNDAAFMCGSESVGNLSGDFNGFMDGKRATLQPVGDGLAFHEFHDDACGPIDVFEAVTCAILG